MKRAFTLIELVIVVALGAILLSTASLSVSRMLERRALRESKTKIVEILRLYADKSFHSGEIYRVTLNYVEKKIEVGIKVGENTYTSIKVEELPTTLKYATVESSGIVATKSATTTKNGGMTSFSVYIFDSKEDARYRIAVDGINTSKLTHVNVYENKLATDATYSNIVAYHPNVKDNPTDDGKWEKE